MALNYLDNENPIWISKEQITIESIKSSSSQKEFKINIDATEKKSLQYRFTRNFIQVEDRWHKSSIKNPKFIKGAQIYNSDPTIHEKEIQEWCTHWTKLGKLI